MTNHTHDTTGGATAGDGLSVPGDRAAAGNTGAAAAKAAMARIGRVLGIGAVVCGGAAFMVFTTRAVAPPVAAPPKAATAMTRTLVMPEEERRHDVSSAAVPRAALPQPPARNELPRPAELTPEQQVLLAAQRAPVTAFDRKRSGPTQTLVTGDERGAGSLRETDDKGAFEKRFTPSAFPSATAGMVSDRRFLLLQGTDIPCVLENAIQSDLPGFASCVITRDVLGANGQVVLMERGTKVFGEYRGGLVAGISRLNVIWARAVTPTGVDVPLGSAATDALGRSGIGGEVDTHFMERFGAALLLSVVNDISQIGASRLQKNEGVTVSSASSGNSAAAIATEQAASIKPTLNVRQGVMVAIKVTRDVDFSRVYTLKQVRNTGVWDVADPNRDMPTPAGMGRVPMSSNSGAPVSGRALK